MKLILKSSRLAIRNSVTRIPFRYGKACLTACPQAVLGVTIESEGREYRGYAADCLPPSWFDKTPGKTYERQVSEMLASIAVAEEVFTVEFRGGPEFFPAWLRAQHAIHEVGANRQFPELLVSFGSSMVERAILDAVCRAAKLPFAAAIRSNLLGVDAAQIHPELNGFAPSDWLPKKPANSIFVRHTIGLADPLTRSDIATHELLDDGLPQTLEEYVTRSGLRFFKIKVCNQLDNDLERLRQVVEIIERTQGNDYGVTLDGNEQYTDIADVMLLVESIRQDPSLRTMWNNVIVIEQPLERGVALDGERTGGMRELAAVKPVIIDESDGSLFSYRDAVKIGYRGVSSKSCKGVIKSLLNNGLTWFHNERGASQDFVMTGEDLCTIGTVSVQSDLCLVATLGLEHVERNGHHYHRGLSYLSEGAQQAALQAHADFYEQVGKFVAPRLTAGRFEIGSLQCPGFGFAVEPDMAAMQDRSEWRFESLGL